MVSRRSCWGWLLSIACGASGCLGTFEAPATDDGAVSDAAAPADLATEAPADLTNRQVTIHLPFDLSVGGAGGRASFDARVKPLTDARCAACHGMPGGLGPPFLAPPAYDSVVAWPKLITRDPTHSLLVTKGAHDGAPFFTGPESLTVLDWLAIEAAALPPKVSQSVATPPMVPMPGANDIPLGPLGKSFLGADISFDATFAGPVLKITNLVVHATGASGLHLVHPLFVVVHGGVKAPDPIDSLENVDQTIPNAQSAALGPGIVILNNVVGMDQLSIAFATIEPSGMAMMPMGGCKSVADFTASAQPAFSSQCVSCHGGANDTSTNALDMRKMNDLSMGAQSAACAQARNRINPAQPAMSQIFLSTAPASMANHPFKFADQMSFDAFVSSTSAWIKKEQ